MLSWADTSHVRAPLWGWVNLLDDFTKEGLNTETQGTHLLESHGAQEGKQGAIILHLQTT